MLRIEGMNTHYGASHVLQGVDLDMPQGRISAVLGRNGVGKTTMVKTIMGLVTLSSGRVAVGDTDITGWAPNRVHARAWPMSPRVGYIFPDLTVIENIKVGERPSSKGAGVADRAAARALPVLARARRQQRLAAIGRRAADAGNRPRARLRSQGSL